MTRRIVLSVLFLWLAARAAGAAVAVDDFFLAVEGNPIAIPFTALLANDEVDARVRWEVVLASVPARGDLHVDLHGFVYKPAAGAWGLETFTYSLHGGPGSSNTATVRLQISPLWAPVAGDWDGDGDLEVGVFKNAPVPYFRLCENLDEEPVCPIYQPFSPGFSGFLPIAGNWGGDLASDPADEVGLYDPVTGRFYLFDLGPERTLPLWKTFRLGVGAQGDLPLAGDWNGNDTVTAGLLLAADGHFALRDTSSAGDYDYLFGITGSQPGGLPFTGDWLQDGTSGVGLYDPAAHRVYLRDALTGGPAEWEWDVELSPEDGPYVPVLGIGDPSGSPELFMLIFFSRTPSALVFHLIAGSIRPHHKVVIPIEPDGVTAL